MGITIEQATAARNAVEARIINHEDVSGVAVSTTPDGTPCVKVYVRREGITPHTLGIKSTEEQVPVIIEVRKITPL
ncbi:hypothetical protein [Chitinophaga solisilvae]|uniref:Uncharacterized protein n=1 Tax=Chitinophaga solisilvae TaxID=1233460 RepID=A0A3S1D127_9BACT|nr:hypothetical protein [Chitinophaga solisilvae]NSL86791.1 hypothetical protein [Chitinophaga solisilvae]